MTDDVRLDFQDRMLSLGLARVSEAAALAAARLIGRGDEKAADQVAVDAMRTQLNMLDIKGTVVIGEGERDEAPMLYIGEEVGSGSGVEVDIALDPLEGTTLTAKAMPNAITVIAMGPRHSMLHAPDVYMDKLAIGPGFPDGLVDIDMSPDERVRVFAKAKGCRPEDVSVCILERPRHKELIDAVRSTGAAIRLITDGDVAGVMHCADPAETGIDMYMGLGGAPEGVLAAAALKCMGGQIQGRLMFRNEDEIARGRRAGIEDLDAKYSRDDMVKADVIFAATGVTDGSILKGARRHGDFIEMETLLMRSRTGSMRRLMYRTRNF
ncbi:class II fructose-bisphosphatase [Paralimibaculum aggregatum]|uniref:Fructose-1,6-bisphosphatase n=1 Tax=Paralimibaculum aggregatum TaxID=3036245 RepID=A0ABQ6LBN4_9RHOB|nr:class II fructose-bisphosphatase [Limibaculum sp. NKW23]